MSFGHHRRDPDLQGANLPELSDAMCLAAIVLFGSFWIFLVCVKLKVSSNLRLLFARHDWLLEYALLRILSQ